MARNKIRRSTRKKSMAVPFIIVCSSVAFSALLAGLWQLNSPKIEVLSPLELDPAITGQYSVSAPAQSESSSSSVSSAASSNPSPVAPDTFAVSDTPVTSVPLPQNQPLAEQSRVTSSYFDDAVFIGDSISVGIKHYDIMSNAQVLAATGIGLENIFTKAAIKDGEQTLTVLDALSKTSGKKIYIMLGANSLQANFDHLIKQYGLLIDEVVNRTDKDAVIYVQSVLPINEPLFHQKYYPNKTTNADIDRFNTMLCELAAQKGVYYLDVASVFKDESNAMPEENTPDGMHIISSQYTIWFDYLKTHAIS